MKSLIFFFYQAVEEKNPLDYTSKQRRKYLILQNGHFFVQLVHFLSIVSLIGTMLK